MTVVRRDGRPNRPQRLRVRGARTGMLALVALGAGAGCGQTMLRPQGGPGLAAASLGRAPEPVPGRVLVWNGLDQRIHDSAAAPGRSADVSVATRNLFGTAISPAKLNAGLTNEGFTRILTASSPTTWNGWKLPPPRGPKASSASAAIASAGLPAPIPRPSATAGGRDPLLAACTRTKIAPPKPIVGGSAIDETLLSASKTTKIALPRRPSGASATESGSGLEGLMAACKATKISPPLLKPRAPIRVARVAPPAPSLTPAPIPSSARPIAPKPIASVSKEPAISPVEASKDAAALPSLAEPATPREPAVVVDSPAAPLVPAPALTLVDRPSPTATAPESIPEPLPLPLPEPTRMPIPVPEPGAAVNESTEPTRKPSLERTSEPVAAAPPAPRGEPLVPAEPTALTLSEPADKSTTRSVAPTPAQTPASAAPPAETVVVPNLSPTSLPVPAKIEASRVTNISLPHQADAPADKPAEVKVAESTTQQDDALVAASQKTKIELSHPLPGPSAPSAGAVDALMDESSDELLKSASIETQIPLPVPVTTQADVLLDACKDAKIPPPVSIRRFP